MLQKINNAYNFFFCFQFCCLAAGILVLLLTPPSGIYVFILFGQTIATIIFGVVASNLSDRYLVSKYPDTKAEISCSAGLTGFRIRVDLDGPLSRQAERNDDQLAAAIIRKKGLLIVFCAVVVVSLVGLARILL